LFDCTEKGSGKPGGRGPQDASADLLAMLRGALEIKNQQIATQSAIFSQQMELIKCLSERLREGNPLMASLQQKAALPDGGRPRPGFVHARNGPCQPSDRSFFRGYEPA
jgi:hypothetical protein